jgi:hypothetical protein
MTNTTKIVVISAGVVFMLMIIGVALGLTMWMLGSTNSQPVMVSVAPANSPTMNNVAPPRPDTVNRPPAMVTAKGTLGPAGSISEKHHIALVGTSRMDVSAFTGVRWNGDAMQVEVQGKWYELVAINDAQEPDILAYAKKTFDDRWEKRMAEDLPQVLNQMGHPVGLTVNLQLRNPDTKEVVTMNDVPVKQENRRSIMMPRVIAQVAAMAGAPKTAALAAAPLAPGPLPFTGLKWHGLTVQVRVNDAWYELAAIDGVTVDQMIADAQKNWGTGFFDRWRRGLVQHMDQILTDLGHAPGATVTLQLRKLDGGDAVTMSDTPMNLDNGQTALSYMIRSPFTAVRWPTNVSPQVQVDGVWYDFVAINDVTLNQLHDFMRQNYTPRESSGIGWHNLFGASLAEALNFGGKSADDTVKLDLKKADGGDAVTLNNVPMTSENVKTILGQK